MKWTLLLLVLTFSANAQSPADKPAEAGETTTAKKGDPKLHADAVRLIELSGAKQRLQDNFKQLVDSGVKQMMETANVALRSSRLNGKSDFLNGQASKTILMS